MVGQLSMIVLKFQSTLPTRGSDELPMDRGNINIPISIHAPHEGERRWGPSAA